MMIGLLDLELGSLKSFGPFTDKKREMYENLQMLKGIVAWLPHGNDKSPGPEIVPGHTHLKTTNCCCYISVCLWIKQMC